MCCFSFAVNDSALLTIVAGRRRTPSTHLPRGARGTFATFSGGPAGRKVEPKAPRPEQVMTMKASVGDRLVIASRHLDEAVRTGEILEVRGSDGEPPYLVRWQNDQHSSLVVPGPDAHVEHPAR
jgi:hypothetical protein